MADAQCDQEFDLLGSLDRFELSGDRESRLVIMLPTQWRGALETVRRVRGRRGGMNAIGVFAVGRGVDLIRRLPGVAEIAAARETAIDLGADDATGWFTSWPYQPHAPGGRARLDLRYVDDDIRTKCAGLAIDLGLGWHAPALALAATLMGVDDVPGPTRLHMLETLSDFRVRLARRAEDAEAIAALIRARPVVDVGSLTFDDVLRDRK